MPRPVSVFQAASTSSGLAMSAMEQPASRLGRITCWLGPPRISALSAMKCTPQKRVNSAVGLGGGLLGKLVRIALEIGELHHLVTLVVVPEDRQPAAKLIAQLPNPGIPLLGRHLEVGSVDSLLAEGSDPVALELVVGAGAFFGHAGGRLKLRIHEPGRGPAIALQRCCRRRARALLRPERRFRCVLPDHHAVRSPCAIPNRACWAPGPSNVRYPMGDGSNCQCDTKPI